MNSPICIRDSRQSRKYLRISYDILQRALTAKPDHVPSLCRCSLAIYFHKHSFAFAFQILSTRLVMNLLLHKLLNFAPFNIECHQEILSRLCAERRASDRNNQILKVFWEYCFAGTLACLGLQELIFHLLKNWLKSHRLRIFLLKYFFVEWSIACFVMIQTS